MITLVKLPNCALKAACFPAAVAANDSKAGVTVPDMCVIRPISSCGDKGAYQIIYAAVPLTNEASQHYRELRNPDRQVLFFDVIY